MRIRKALCVFSSMPFVVVALAGPASAGGMPTPPPAWMGPAIVTALVIVGAAVASVVAIGVAQRWRDR